jgi:flagellar biosynthesis anti-sigma factor FlgM
MKINDGKGVQGPGIDGTGAARPAPAAGASRGAEVIAPAADQVSVSETARQLAQLHADVGDPLAVRADKVEGLRAVMAKGHYSADIQQVAQKFLHETLGHLLA